MLGTRRAARQITRIYEGAFTELDLTGGQFSILVALDLQQNPPISALAEGLGMDRTTLSRALGPLQRRGLVNIVNDPEDSRTRRVSLSHQGQCLLASGRKLWAGAQRQVEQQFDKDELESIKYGLKIIGEST